MATPLALPMRLYFNTMIDMNPVSMSKKRGSYQNAIFFMEESMNSMEYVI